MKVFIAVIIMILSYTNIVAQTVLVSNMRQNIVFIGQKNSLKIMYENAPCSSLIVSTDNGKIIKKNNCEYEYTPSKKGMAQVIVKAAGKSTYNYLLRVEDKPLPKAYMGTYNGGNITISYLEPQRGLIVKYPGIDNDIPYKVKAFSIQLFKENEMIFSKFQKSNTFDREVKSHLAKLNKNDIILIHNIIAEDSLGSTIHLQPIQFNIQ